MNPSSPVLSPADVCKLGDLPTPEPRSHFVPDTLDQFVHKEPNSSVSAFLKSTELDDPPLREMSGLPPPMIFTPSFMPDLSKHPLVSFHHPSAGHAISSSAFPTLYHHHPAPPPLPTSSSVIASALEHVADQVNDMRSRTHHFLQMPVNHLPSNFQQTPHGMLSFHFPVQLSAQPQITPYHPMHKPLPFTPSLIHPVQSIYTSQHSHSDVMSSAFPKLSGGDNSQRDCKNSDSTESNSSCSYDMRMMPPLSGGLSLCPPLPPLLRNHPGSGRGPLGHWSQADVLQWLDRVRLSALKDVFQRHEITGDMLLELKEEDLVNDMGISNGTLRRSLVREIKSLKDMLSHPDHKSDCDSRDDEFDCDLARCVVELNHVMHDEGLSQPKVARALGIQSQGHLSELLRGKYKHSRSSSAQHWAKEIRTFLSLTAKERQELINMHGNPPESKRRKSSKRTVWSKEQAMMLEAFFHHKPSPTKPERQLLATQCGVDMGVISTYFQNKRRRSRHMQSENM